MKSTVMKVTNSPVVSRPEAISGSYHSASTKATPPTSSISGRSDRTLVTRMLVR